jgi:hypothetical protein
MGDGLTPQTAWRSVDKANKAVRPGDTALLSGHFDRECINPRRDGASDAPITFKAYGCSIFDKPGTVNGIPYTCYLGARRYVDLDGITFKNSDPLKPVANKGVIFRSSKYCRLINCVLDKMQVQLIGSSYCTLEGNTGREFVAQYDKDDQPLTAGDMLYLCLGSHHNTIRKNDLAYAGHSLIEVGNGSGNDEENAENLIEDNVLSNPWYKCLILSDDGGTDAPTVVQRNKLLDANSVPTLIWTVPPNVGEVCSASCAVQFSGRHFVLIDNDIENAVAFYGIVTFGSRHYAGPPAPSLIESTDNLVEGNRITNCRGRGAFSFEHFMSQADVDAGRVLPELTRNIMRKNILSGNAGTPYSYDGSLRYLAFHYHAATMAPPWQGLNGNQAYENQLDGDSPAKTYRIDTTFRGKTVKQVQSLAQFEASDPENVYGNFVAAP